MTAPDAREPANTINFSMAAGWPPPARSGELVAHLTHNPHTAVAPGHLRE